MPKVSAAIKEILKQKDAGVVSGAEAVRDILKELQKQVKTELGAAAVGGWDAYSLKKMLNSTERHIAEFDSGARKKLSALLDSMWDGGRLLVETPLAVAGIYTGFNISASSLNVLKEFTFHKISGMSNDAFSKIRGELTLGVLGGKTPQEVAKAIGMNLTDPSIFSSIDARAEAITKTEMGRVFSTAAQKRMGEAAGYVDGLEKQWVHAGHPRMARPYHLALNGRHVPVNEPFLVGNVPMMYPRDPGAPINEVINCGCDHVPYHANWN